VIRSDCITFRGVMCTSRFENGLHVLDIIVLVDQKSAIKFSDVGCDPVMPLTEQNGGMVEFGWG
jgi:hypothetical protein